MIVEKFANAKSLGTALLMGIAFSATSASAKPLQHDAEHYQLVKKYGTKWAEEDKEISKKLANVYEMRDVFP